MQQYLGVEYGVYGEESPILYQSDLSMRYGSR